ncbi:ABC transporter permease [Corynebacterium zhongnanshanii]|uniref:ABC transporter permease n=2 Tax=Corynebacteriaceae TaxID=1653 RepID=UPI0031453D48
MNGIMFQGLAELRTAKARTALIITTIMMITIMVTFLSSLAAGLSHQSVSALQYQLEGNKAVVVNGTGLSSSHIDDAQAEEIQAAGGRIVHIARTPDTIYMTGDGPEDLYLEHQPITWAPDHEVDAMPGAASFGVVDPDYPAALQGKDALNTSGSYQGEQSSLSLMITLLYVISALVLGAFFAVWTIQRLRGVAITAALGGSRPVIMVDALGQALVVLALGIVIGTLVTLGAGSLISGIPIVLSQQTIATPALILLAAGLLGAAISIKPILSINPRSALTC